MTEFGPLFKKTSTGATQTWAIQVEGATITTTYGQLGGAMQTAVDTITEGKNVGRSNETTPEQQALAEAKSQFEKKLKGKGYVRSLEALEAGEVDELVEGGLEVLLAHKFVDYADKVTYPALLSRKIDGMRCVAIIENGECTLWSRTRKRINSIPHINEALKKQFGHSDTRLAFDGEVFVSGVPFEKVMSLIRPNEPVEGHEAVEYHIFDVMADHPFVARYEALRKNFESAGHPLFLVKNVWVQSEFDVMALLDQYLAEGYEGAMFRDPEAPYIGKRHKSLIKVKKFDDADFPIIGIEEGRGKMAGHAAVFVCQLPNGETVKPPLNAPLEELRLHFEDHSRWQGRLMVTKYQGLTKLGIPRFPKGLRIRDPLEG